LPVRTVKWWLAAAVPWHPSQNARSKGRVPSFFRFQPGRQAVEPDERLDLEAGPHHGPSVAAYQNLGDERAGVVGARLHRPIGAGRHHGEEIARVGIGNVAILGITNDRNIVFPDRDLEIWGNAHRDYMDMVPLRDPPPRAARWHVAMGHGHYEPPETWHNPLRPSWLISDAMIAATAADYLALGHWDRAAQVGCGAVPAYYSGSPDYVHTINLVRLTAAGEVIVTREPVMRGD